MSDLTLPIIGLTTLAGYFFSQNGRNPRVPAQERSNIEKFEKPNGDNIYESHQFDAVNQEILTRSLRNYKDAENPALTGVLPPLYNSYSAIGNDLMLTPATQNQVIGVSSQQQADINRINRVVDVTSSSKPPVIDQRPMFNQTFTYKGKERDDVGTELNVTNTEISLLTGKPMDTSHNNMVPFFGSNLTQNVEKFTNESLLENQTGKNPTFKHKTEIAPLFAKMPQDIYGTPIVTENVDTDRYIPSLYRQNEKPFQDQKVQRPIAWTVDNDAKPWNQYKNVDELRAANKPKVSYQGTTVPGQRGEVRGVIGQVYKRTPETFYEQTPDHLLKTTGQFLAPQSQQNYTTNFKPTARNSYNTSYFGGASAGEVQKGHQAVTLDGDDIQASLVQTPKRINFANDYTRNAVGNKTVNDYGRGSMKSYETERYTTGQETHILNANQASAGIATRPSDHAKTTLKETNLLADNSGNVKTSFDHGGVNAYYAGISGMSAKTTHKETTLTNNYKGIMNKQDGMGYLVNKYEAKTTGKEIVSSNSEHTGNAGNGLMKHISVYSTYDSPEKVRNAVHAQDYRGNANYNSESMSRVQYQNADIREHKEVVVSGQRPSGPQKFQIASGKDVVGEIKTTDNLLFKEQEERREQMNRVLPQILSGKDSLGYQTKTRFDDEPVDTVFSDRLQPDLVIAQHNQNPYSIRKGKISGVK